MYRDYERAPKSSKELTPNKVLIKEKVLSPAQTQHLSQTVTKV